MSRTRGWAGLLVVAVATLAFACQGGPADRHHTGSNGSPLNPGDREDGTTEGTVCDSAHCVANDCGTGSMCGGMGGMQGDSSGCSGGGMHDGMHDGMHGSMHGDSAGCGMARMHDGMTACSCGPNHPHCGADSSADSTGGTPGGGGIDDHAGHHGM